MCVNLLRGLEQFLPKTSLTGWFKQSLCSLVREQQAFTVGHASIYTTHLFKRSMKSTVKQECMAMTRGRMQEGRGGGGGMQEGGRRGEDREDGRV